MFATHASLTRRPFRPSSTARAACIGDVRSAVFGSGDMMWFDRGEQDATGSEAGTTAVMVWVRDLVPTSSALDSDP